MGRPIIRAAAAVSIALLALAALAVGTRSAAPPKESGTDPICFWSAHGMICVERAAGLGAAEPDAEDLLTALLAGPTAEERAQGIRSAIPAGTALDKLQVQPGETVTVYLRMSPDALQSLDHETFEIIIEQIGWTLEPLGWRNLRVQTWDPSSDKFVPLSAFLPDIPAPRKETALVEQEPLLSHTSQPPAPGQGQPQGALSGKTVYVSAGHGWEWNGSAWRTQRPPYQDIIEDHNNAEAVNQYLLQYLWNAGAMIWPVRERDMNAAEMIIDNDGPLTDTGYFETGVWTTTASAGTGYSGSDYRWTETVTGTPTAAAVWTATLPADGEYAVYVWYRPATVDRPADAHYTVHHAGGDTTVTVDQQHHGITWHYIGSYGFQGGKVATVTLSNLSASAGKHVIADAVRFGGGFFDDLTGIGTTAPAAPDKPWWEVASFYYVQKMGMDKPPYGDVTARPIYARWEHAGTGDDAVYVSWHTNGYNGSARGTETYAHSGETLTRTQGSLTLCHTIHTEVVRDIRAGWDSLWTDRGEKTRNLGELRGLWDDDPATRMPGALIEIAFHDNPDDAAALKEPAFQLLAARAVYQGILHYFDPDGVELPEPPTHLAVQNTGGGQVRVSWQPSPTDTVGLVGDAATGYRVYTSTSGLGWSDGVSATGATVYTITGLADDQLLFVRVTAVNAGGESFPTEVLAARVGDTAGVLMVNGFDRLNSTMLISEDDPVEGSNLRMFLNRMNRYDYAIQHGEAITYPFDSSSNEAVQEGTINLDDYGVVDWILGEESVNEETLNGTEQSLLSSYLAGGGALFISGAEIGWDLDHLGSSYDRAFYTSTLRVEYAGDDAETYEVAPAAGSIFAGLGSFRFDAAGMYDADYPDQIAPTSGSTPTLTYSGGQGGTAAIQYQSEVTTCPRLVYFGFPFETIRPEQRYDVMARVMGFLAPCLPQSPSTRITSPAHLSAHNTTPLFAGTAQVTGASIERVEVQIQRPGSDHWTGAAWVTGTTWLTATGTSVWTYTLPMTLPVEGDYYLQARAWTTNSISDTSPAEVLFTYDTIPPTATTLITPTGGITIPAVTGVTLMWEASPPDGGSSLAYVLELDGQLYTTTQEVYATGHLAEGRHVWGAQVFDAAGNHSGWVTDTFYVNQYQTYLPLVIKCYQ